MTMDAKIFLRRSGAFGVMIDGKDTHLAVEEDSGMFSVFDDGDSIVLEKPKAEAEAAINAVYPDYN